MLFRLTLTVLLAFTAQTSAQFPAPSSPPEPKLELQRHLALPPGPGNPRNSEGDFVRLNDGRWLFIYTHFTTGSADHAQAHLASRESSDGGLTWTGADKIVVPNEGGFNVMSVSLLRLHSGEIALFYLRKNSHLDCRPLLRLSKDEAATWSDPIECIPDHLGYYVLNNSRVIQLESGRLILPTALHAFENGKLLPGKVVVHLSDDAGKTWRRSSTELEHGPDGKRVSFMEPGVVEVTPHDLFMVIRTKTGRQFTSRSSDRGERWTPAAGSSLMSPESPATVKKIPSTGHLLLVWNDHSHEPDTHRATQPRFRTPLAAAVSRDGGKTWEESKLLEDQPDHGYCYTALAFTKDRVLLAYCAHRSRYGLETTQISSFKIDDLYR